MERALAKSVHFYSTDIFRYLNQELTVIAKLVFKNLLKKQPYSQALTDNLIAKAVRNLIVLKKVGVARLCHNISVVTELEQPAEEDADVFNCVDEAKAIHDLIFYSYESGSARWVDELFANAIMTGNAACLAFKQQQRFPEALAVAKATYLICCTLKGSSNPRLLRRMIEANLSYASFLYQLRCHQQSLKLLEDTLLQEVELFCNYFSFREINSSRKQHKFQSMWKTIIITLLSMFLNLTALKDYDRCCELHNLIVWVDGAMIVEDFAFRKSLSAKIEENAKAVKRYVEVKDQLTQISRHFFDSFIKVEENKLETKEPVPEILTHYNSCMQEKFRQKKMNTHHHARANNITANNTVSTRDKRTLRRNQSGTDIKSGKSEKYYRFRKQQNPLNIIDSEIFKDLTSQTLIKNLKRAHCSLQTRSFGNSFMENNHTKNSNSSKGTQNNTSVQAKQLFRKYVPPKTIQNLIVDDGEKPSKPQSSMMRGGVSFAQDEQADRKFYLFAKRQLKMKNCEDINNMYSQKELAQHFFNTTEAKLKITQEAEFVFLNNQKIISTEHREAQSQLAAVVPALKGAKLFAEILMRNRELLGVTKLMEKHDIVRKKQKNMEKARLKNQQGKKIVVARPNTSYSSNSLRIGPNLSALLEMREKGPMRRNACLQQETQDRREQQQNDQNQEKRRSKPQRNKNLQKLIVYSNTRGQETIKKLSEKIQEHLFLDKNDANKNRKLKKTILENNYCNLRQSVNQCRASLRHTNF